MAQHQEQPGEADGSPIVPGPAPGAVDERVAANLRRLREKQGWSQADLSARMTALGWRYHPQTVHKNENGQRKVTVGEAEALARIFGTTIDRLGWLEGEDAAVAYGEQAISLLRQAVNAVAGAVAGLHAAQAGAAVAVRGLRRDSRGGSWPRVSRTADALEEELADATLENALGEGEARWDRLRNGEGDVGQG